MKFQICICFVFATSAWSADADESGHIRGIVDRDNRKLESSDVPSTTPSDRPSTAPSDQPSSAPSTRIYEDAVMKGLSALNLVDFVGAQAASSDALKDSRGIEYPLANLQPYADIFSSDSYTVSLDGMSVSHKITNETMRIPIFRSVYENNTVVQLATTDEGSITFAEIRGQDAKFDTFFVQEGFASALVVQEDGSSGISGEALLSFTLDDIDNEKLANFTLGDLMPTPNRTLQVVADEDNGPILFYPSRRVSASAACSSFKIVKVAIVYDSALCGAFGGASGTRNKIVSIIASASVFYERDLCTKLQLTDIYSPDRACGGDSATFGSFSQSNICSSGGLIHDFADWMAPRRDALGFDKGALVHLFTGMPKCTSTIGCAFTGGFCSKDVSFGVALSTFSTNLLIQSVVFAHEVGHNLNAEHYYDNSGRFNYIMEPAVTSGSDGFDQVSKNSILGMLARTSCDTVQSSPSPPSSPKPPVAPPTSSPSVEGCRTKPEVAAPTCISPQSGVTGGFACFLMTEILPPFCSVKNLRWAHETCNGEPLRKSSRRVLSSMNSTFVADSNATHAASNSSVAVTEAAVTTFKSSSCSSTCILTSNSQVCFSANKKDGHLLTFIALNARSIARSAVFIP